MSNYYHGVQANKQATSVSTPVVANCGIHFCVGTAPVHTVGGAVNEPVLVYDYTEAVKALGYSDDWEKYDLCEEMYTALVLYKIAPIVLVNVLDPAKHKAGETTADFTLENGVAKLPYEALADSLEVRGYTNGDALTDKYTRGVDYELIYSDGVLKLEAIEGGSITSSTAKLNIKYNAVDPAKVTKADIIGGYNTETEKTEGFELLDSVFPKFRIVPELLLAPNFSHDSEVAAVMNAKAEKINNLFTGKAICDVDTTVATTYQKAVEWKNSKNITKVHQIVGFPMFKLGDKVFHHATQLAGCMTATDAKADLGGGSPCESASNKSLQVDGMVLADGTEVLLDLTKANYLNSQGIITGLNLMGGFVSWGNESACYPANTDITDYIYCINRMFAWVGQTLILSTWSKVDRGLKPRLLESVKDSVNLWLNGIMGEGKILGGRVEFNESENVTTDIMAGKARFHIYLTPPTPAKELEFIMEYDVSYLETLFA